MLTKPSIRAEVSVDPTANDKEWRQGMRYFPPLCTDRQKEHVPSFKFSALGKAKLLSNRWYDEGLIRTPKPKGQTKEVV